MPMTSKQMIQILEKNGFIFERSNGSHYFYQNPNTGKTVTVPFHSKDLKKGTEQNILKQAGLK